MPTTPLPVEPTVPVEAADDIGGGTGIANPASVYCEEQGYTLEMRTDENGGQYGVCLFPDGSECEEWAFFRGACEPGETVPDDSEDSIPPPLSAIDGVPVVAWYGQVIGLPEGSEHDDYLLVLPEGTAAVGLDSQDKQVRAEIPAMRLAPARLPLLTRRAAHRPRSNPRDPLAHRRARGRLRRPRCGVTSRVVRLRGHRRLQRSNI